MRFYSKTLTNKVNKSDLCNSMVWNDSMEYTAYFMKTIINEAIDSGNIPDVWKVSTITPIQKLRNTNLADEHRPINNLSAEAKIMELYVKEQLIEYFERNKLIYINQSAFRKYHSCESTLNFVLHDWMVAKDNGLCTIAVFLDLKRAFETVDRPNLIHKLTKLGIRNNELKFFEDNLRNRKQRTKYQNTISNDIQIDVGVPQGTALSVLLFIMCINDIAKVPIHCTIILFADDTVIYVVIKYEVRNENKSNRCCENPQKQDAKYERLDGRLMNLITDYSKQIENGVVPYLDRISHNFRV